METTEDTLIDEISQMTVQYRAEVTGHRKEWPRSIRERVEKLGELGLKPKKIAEKTPIPYETVLQWRYERNRFLKLQAFHSLPVAQPDNATVTVALNGDAKASTAPLSKVTVTTPSGYQIAGEAKSVISVLRALGRR